MGLRENKVDQDGGVHGSFDFLNVNCCRRTAFAVAPSEYSTVPLVLVGIMLRRHLKSNDIYRHYIHFVILLTLESAQRLDVNLAMIDLTSSGEPKTTLLLTQQRRTVPRISTSVIQTPSPKAAVANHDTLSVSLNSTPNSEYSRGCCSSTRPCSGSSIGILTPETSEGS